MPSFWSKEEWQAVFGNLWTCNFLITDTIWLENHCPLSLQRRRAARPNWHRTFGAIRGWHSQSPSRSMLISVLSTGGEDKKRSRASIRFIHSKITACPDCKPFRSAYSTAKAIGVPHPMVLRHLPDSVGMKNCHLRWTSHARFVFHDADKSFQMIIPFAVFHVRAIYHIS
jgi:hypothetical protein